MEDVIMITVFSKLGKFRQTEVYKEYARIELIFATLGDKDQKKTFI